jgi:hypothetical protein
MEWVIFFRKSVSTLQVWCWKLVAVGRSHCKPCTYCSCSYFIVGCLHCCWHMLNTTFPLSSGYYDFSVKIKDELIFPNFCICGVTLHFKEFRFCSFSFCSLFFNSPYFGYICKCTYRHSFLKLVSYCVALSIKSIYFSVQFLLFWGIGMPVFMRHSAKPLVFW